MGIRSAKTTAVIFAILFLGYYQRWLYVPILESLSGKLAIDPQVPELLGGIHNANSLHHEKGEILNSKGKAKGPLLRKIDPELELEAAKLSRQMQRELEVSQRAQNINLISRGCKQPKLICGAPIDCNIGCQIHYVMNCLQIAYVTNRTLIINWQNWPYMEMSWSDLFLPIGVSECMIDNDTASVIWSRSGIEISYPDMSSFPYKSGLPIPYKISDVLRRMPTNQLLWWNGQFAKFTLRLQLTEEELMRKLKTAMKFYLPTVGILMRKRDKLSEKKPKSSQSMSIDKYLTTARKYFTKLEELIPSVTRRVFIATDDRNIIKLVRKRYRLPKWEILGLQLKTDVEDLVKDIYMLTECDFVICSFSTDICRLVAELKESAMLNSSDRVKSLDQNQKYTYAVPGFKKLQLLQQII